MNGAALVDPWSDEEPTKSSEDFVDGEDGLAVCDLEDNGGELLQDAPDQDLGDHDGGDVHRFNRDNRMHRFESGVSVATGAVPEQTGAQLLHAIESWYRRFICVTDDRDLSLLAVWTLHTHVAESLRTTPRLQLDSTVPESGKTTVLDHMMRLCSRPIMVASPPSPALIPRLLELEVRTILIDEVDRVLRPDGPATPDLLSIINSGYRTGASRPVLIPGKGGGWDVSEMPTFSPVVLSGNAPMLPDDTKSRITRILLMPDYDGVTEDSDWEFIEADAEELHTRISEYMPILRTAVTGLEVELPDGCVRRSKERWRPLKRVAIAAGGKWPHVVDELIKRSLEEDAAEREAGLRALPPGMVILTDLHHVWPDSEDLIQSEDLVRLLIQHNPDYWSADSAYGKALTQQRLGKLVVQSAKVTTQRPGGRGHRGYLRRQFVPVWQRLRIEKSTGAPSVKTGATGYTGDTGAVCTVCRYPLTPGMSVNGLHPDCAAANGGLS